MGLLDGQEGAGLRRRERPLDRLGHRPGAPRRGRRRSASRRSRASSSGASGRSRTRSGRRSSSLRRPVGRPRSSASSAQWRETHGELDILVHALAFAKREDLDGAFVDTSRDGFALALDVSAYSLVALAREARPLLHARLVGLTLTYYGAEKVVANYNVMGVAKAALEASVRYLAADLGPDGVRVNAISAGPDPDPLGGGHRRLQEAVRLVRRASPRCARTSRSRTSARPRSGSRRTSRAP